MAAALFGWAPMLDTSRCLVMRRNAPPGISFFRDFRRTPLWHGLLTVARSGDRATAGRDSRAARSSGAGVVPFADFAVQPRPRVTPIALGRDGRDPQDLGGLLVAQARVEAELDQPGPDGVLLRQPRHGFVEGEQILVAHRGGGVGQSDVQA